MKRTTFRTRCPGCRKLIAVIEPPITSFHLSYSHELLQQVISGNFNQVFCTTCKKLFRHEVELFLFHEINEYAILADAREQKDIMRGNAELLQLFGHSQFRFRSVRFGIEAIEKVRIFEDGWDDRAIEFLKYDFCPQNIKDNKGNDLLLYNGTAQDKILFRVFDDFDQPTQMGFEVPAVHYYDYASRFSAEFLDSPSICWKRIDSDWAEAKLETR